MARDLGDATGQTYPRIEWPVIEAPVRPIGAFWAGMAGSAEPEIGASRAKFRRFMVGKWRILGDPPGPELAPRHQRIPHVLMYLGIQVLAGCQELEIATFANTVRCFWTSGNPGFEQFRGARNRDFRDEVPAFWWPAI